MARLKSRYRETMAVEGASDVQAPETAAANDHLSAAAAAPLLTDDGSTANRLREQLEVMRERIDVVPPSDIDSAVEAAKAQSIGLEPNTGHDPEPADDGDDLDTTLGKTGLPPLAVSWLKANPIFLYDSAANERLQATHHALVAEGFASYGQSYFREMSRRLNGGAVDTSTDGELDAALRELEIAERRRDRIAELNKQYDQIIEETKSPIDHAIADGRASRAHPALHIDPPRKPPVSAPPSRESLSWNGGQRTGSRITLTAQQKEAARISGITEIEYAANLIRLQEEKANGHYGGQP